MGNPSLVRGLPLAQDEAVCETEILFRIGQGTAAPENVEAFVSD